MTPNLFRRVALTLVAAGAMAGCSLDSLVDVPRPSNILDPDALETYDGAIGMYNGALSEFNRAFMGGQQQNGGGGVTEGNFAIAGGVLSDEFTLPGADDIDQRTDLNGLSGAYTFPIMAEAFVNSGQALQYLRQYAPNAPTEYPARMHLQRGYLALFMSELFCSGVPLSDAVEEGEVVYGVPRTTAELQEFALAQFDTALSPFGADTGRVALAARMGRARAYLGLKQYDKAAEEAGKVPTSYHYDATYSTLVATAAGYFQPGGVFAWVTASDNEGVNGLPFVSSGDPRVKFDKVSNINQIDIYQPHAWRASGNLSIPVENGIDARLIEAEYLLSQGKTTEWLQKLNDLRAGAGGVSGLAPLVDPVTPAARLKLTFDERAFWLYGTGHRQGDLRRLVRQYSLPQSAVYPSGAYINGLLYGIYTNIGLGVHEVEANANYHGCIDREA
jgi:hypothetical protein